MKDAFNYFDLSGELVTKEWKSHLELLAPLAKTFAPMLEEPEDPLMREELYQSFYSGVVGGYFARFLSDADNPQFLPNLNEITNFATPNPDDVYNLAILDPDGAYKLSGYRGTVHVLDFQLGGGNYYLTGQMPFPFTISNHLVELSDLDANGYFEVLICAERPAGHSGMWWKLDPRTTHVMMRSVAYDWLNELDPRVAIERLDKTVAKPRPTIENIRKNMQLVASWVEGQTRVSLEWMNRYRMSGLINKIAIHNLPEGGLDNQKYGEGIFKLEADEALIYESEVPKGRYWTIHLNDMMWRTIDSFQRQACLNGFTAKLDNDGKFRAVISIGDPGVPNWIDTWGYKTGTIMARWLDCEDLTTVPTITRVKLAEVRNHLPAETPVVTPAEREESIRIRNRARQMRKRW